MIKAFSFIRFSTPAQLKGDSLRRQLAKSERYAAAHNLDLDTSMRALGVSAYRGDHRRKGPLADFLVKIETGEIARGSYLIVENTDRLSRENPWDALGLFREIIEAGIVVVSLVDDMIYSRETLTKRPESMNTLQASLTKGHRESRDKADRLQEVWGEKRLDIENGGRKKLTRQGPAWLDLIPDHPSDPLVGEWHFNDRVQTIQEIIKLCLSGIGKGSIAAKLNALKIGSFKHGDGWNASVVGVLLKDRRLLGELQLFTKVDGPRRPIGDPIKGYFPAVLDEDTFWRVQGAIAQRHTGARAGKRGARVPNLFTGIGQCECGRVMEYRNKLGKRCRLNTSVTLKCSGAVRHHGCENHQSFVYSAVEAMVLDWVSDITITDQEANRATVAAIKLDAKNAELSDIKRRLHSSMEKWEIEDDDRLKDMLYANVKKASSVIHAIEVEISTLEVLVRDASRSVVGNRRAAVKRHREAMASLKGDALYEARAKLGAAIRQTIDHLEFTKDRTVNITLRGGLKLYRFRDGEYLGAFDISDANPGGGDEILTFPSASRVKQLGINSQLANLVRDELITLSS